MSLRLLKKVLQEQDGLQHQIHPDADGGDEEVDEEEYLDDSKSFGNGARSSINPFDLLNDGEEDPDSEKEMEPEIADEAIVEKKNEERHQAPRTANTKEAVPSGKKSKKKKKKKKKEGATAPNAVAKTGSTLDETLEALSLDLNSPSHRTKAGKGKIQDDTIRDNSFKKPLQSVLRVDPKYLNVENELRRIFGSKVVKSFEKGNQGRQRGGRRGIHHAKKTHLISPSEKWPPWDGSFSMEFLETKDGYNYFRYVYSPSYEQAQKAFEAAKAMHDLNGVTVVLLHHPYHLDSLITMMDYFKLVGEHQMAADVAAKCLYALECAWHPTFTPFEGNCQLKYNHETNKAMFTTLSVHMSSIDRRGCHRSALEVCKLLLSLDRDDPVGALFSVDYFALRAEEYKWLEQFSEEYDSDHSLCLLPNFSYSLAISRFYLEKMESSSSEETRTVNSKPSSLDLMKQALMLHPMVLKKLVDKVPLKDQAWSKMLNHSYFQSDQSKIPSLDHIINIYVERSYLIWRLPDVQKLLRSAAEIIIESPEEIENEATDWICVRKEAFPSDKNEYAHLSVHNFSDAVQTLPPDNLQNFVVDPRMMDDPAMDPRMRDDGDEVEVEVEGIEGGVEALRDLLREPFFELIHPLSRYAEDDGEMVADPHHHPDDDDHGHGGDPQQ